MKIIELYRELTAANAIGLQIDFGDELTRMGRVVHSNN